MRLVIMTLLLVTGRMELLAQNSFVERYNAFYLSLQQGLPCNFVDDIYADSDGFMWISTYGGGLVRYDGYTVTDFGVGSQGLSLRSNSCKNICEDRFHRLWIAFDEYTEVLDLTTLQPVALDNHGNRVKEILAKRAVRVYGDSKGRMWLATLDEIYCLSFKEDGCVQVIAVFPYSCDAPDIVMKDIDGDGSVWIGARGNIFRLTVQGDRISRSPVSQRLDELIHNAYITDFVKKNNIIWISTNAGLFRYDPYINKVETFNHTAMPGSLIHNYVTSLAVSDDNRLLVGTLSGVDILDETTGAFEHWNAGSHVNPLSSNFVNGLYTYQGQIWVATDVGGAVRLVPRRLSLTNFRHTEALTSLSPNAVNTLYAEPSGRLWLGTVEGGLNMKEPNGTIFTHFTVENTRLSHNSVSALTSDDRKNLWVGTWGGGVNVLDLDNPSAVHGIQVSPFYQERLNFVGALAYDHINHALWIGSNDGVFLYDLKRQLVTEPFDGCRNIRGCIGSLIDHEGNLWMGCLEGVVVINLKKRNRKGQYPIRALKYKLDDPNSGVIDKISSFCQTKDGTLWIGSNAYGLYQRQVDRRGKETYRNFTMKDGLANNSVKGIVEGQNGTLWITTANGLSHFNPKTGMFTNYAEQDGLVSAQFYWNSATRSPDGELYFGSEKGLVVVRESHMTDLYKGRLHFTRLLIGNQLITSRDSHIDLDISSAKRIKMHESEKSLAIEFSALNYASERQGIYSYRLLGFEKEWVQLPPGQHGVRYASLPPGTYQFQVRYAAGAEKGYVSQISIEVIVTPYFWKSWWFLTLLTLLMMAFFMWLYHYRLEIVKKKESERLLRPLEEAIHTLENPRLLQNRIQGIIDNHRKVGESRVKSVAADREEQSAMQMPFMDQLLAVMEKNYGDASFGVEELSHAMCMSRAVLARRLTTETGMPTSQFIRSYRLEVAKNIIVENSGNRNIAEIAYNVGFNDPKYFTRCFTRQYGSSPSVYKSDKV